MSKELEALRKIGLMTTKRNLQDFPIGNQPKQIVKMKIKEMPEFQEVVNALNELKRLKKFKETFDNYELAKKQDFIAYENWLECEAELKKLPTADEVCKTLSEFVGREVSYTNKQFHYIIKNTQVLIYVTETYDNNTFSLGVYLPPHLITLIGRFYEGVTG